jgi:hypothetical protein
MEKPGASIRILNQGLDSGGKIRRQPSRKTESTA